MRIIAMLVAFLCIPSLVTAEDPASPPARQRILLLGQKPDSHPAATHEYMAGVNLLARLLAKTPGLQTIVVQADSPWKDGPELLDGADGAILFLTEGARWVSEEPQRLEAFRRLAKRGGALACLHWGMGTRDAAPVADFTALFGACHGGPDRKYQVLKVRAAAASTSHPVLAGIAPFDVHDEFYYALKRPVAQSGLKLTPLIKVPIDGSDESVAWGAERPDGGRSFGFSGLHFHENWKLTEYRRLVLQGILWTLKRPIRVGGEPVDVSPDDLALPTRQ